MFKDRRRILSPPEEYMDNQLDQWRWDSHLWVNDEAKAHVYMCCEWCGWTPPTEMPLSHATLCTENPVIKAHRQQIQDKAVEAFKIAMDTISKVFGAAKKGG